MIHKYVGRILVGACLALWGAALGTAHAAAPTVIQIDPAAGQTLLELSQINITFDESVIGVNASDVLINGNPATAVVTNDPNNYTFRFTQPPVGVVQMAWAANNGITDTTPQANPFAGGSWSYTLDTNILTKVVISEFMADNANGIRDEDGAHSPWIELGNLSSIQAPLDGWFLTDTPTNLTKWRFPAGMPPLQGGNFLVVWASGNNRTNPLAPLHTNFKLDKLAGGYLALVDPTTNVFSSFVSYPDQLADVSYGRDAVDPNLVGYFVAPTPGKQNSTRGVGFSPDPVFSVDTGIYTNSTLALSLSSSAGVIRYTLNATAPTTNSPIYTGPLNMSNSTVVKARVFQNGLWPSQVIAKNYIFLDGTTAGFNSNLPLLIISTQGQPIPANVPPGGVRAEGTVAVIDASTGRSSVRNAPEYLGMAGFEIYGQTSAGFPKLPIRVELHDSLGNQFDSPLLGMPADNDWKLRNPYDDKTYMNDFLGYELFEKMGNYSCRRRFVEVFVDTGGGRLNYAADYYGVMVLFESIKVGANRVNIAPLTPYATNEPAITGGWMFKKDKDSTGDINFVTAGGNGFSSQTLKIHEPKVNQFRTVPVTGPLTPYGSNQLAWLTRYLNQMEKALYATNWLATNVVGTTNHYSNYLDVNSFVDFHWVVEFTKQIDGVRLSDYFHKDRLGKVAFGPIWDWNLSFGNANYLQGGWTNGWYYEELGDNDHIWLRRLITGTTSPSSSSGDPEFTQKIADRWSVLRTNVMNGSNVLRRIDELSSMLSEAAARDNAHYQVLGRGKYIWPNPDYISTSGSDGHEDIDYINPPNYLGTDTNSIIFNLKKWMAGRFSWIDSQFTTPPTISATDGPLTNTLNVTITPPSGTTLYYTLDGTDPRAPGGAVGSNALSNAGPVTLPVATTVRIFARARGVSAWKGTWSGPATVSLYSQIPPLRITEVMFQPLAPPAGSSIVASDLSYVEVKNIGSTNLNVNRFTLGGAVQFQCPNVVLTPGQSAVIVANVAAFQSLYGSSVVLLGTFSGSLANGNHLTLAGGLGEPILDFTYDPTWYLTTKGYGFSLVVVNPTSPTTAWNSAANWRPSSLAAGSPGQDDPVAPPRPPVLITEILSNPSGGGTDAIELYNPTGTAANIGGWFLTDNHKNPISYVIPAGTTIPAGSYAVFYASTSFGAGTNGFGLSGSGEEVYLFSGDGSALTGYAHGFVFGASPKNVTIGRYVNSVGTEQFVLQRAVTLGTTNLGPLVGPIVVSEINYHPPDIALNGIGFDNPGDEYIELQNITGGAVSLYDTAAPTNTWELANAVTFHFPTGVAVPAGGFVLVVPFDPAADPAATASFRSRNLIPASVPLYGPWQSDLMNGGGTIELLRPDNPGASGVPYIDVDRIDYSNTAPWPVTADGIGLTLQRIVPYEYGNDPTNWVAVAPSPGSNFVAGGTAPNITSQGGSFVIPTGTDVLLSVSANGSAPLLYQWRFNALNIPGATQPSLLLTNFQLSQVGVYSALVYNNAGSALSSGFNLGGRVSLKVMGQPTNRLAQIGQTTNFTVSAVGTGILRYQWRFNGANILSATNATLVVTNIQTTNQGSYVCALVDDFNSLNSQPATLTVVYLPQITIHPLSQAGVAGQSFSLSVAAAGTTPINFRWRKGGVTVTNGVNHLITTLSNSTLVIPSLATNDAATYTVVVTNIAGLSTGGPQRGLSSNAVVTVLLDSDGDGLPDDWETAHGFNPNDPSDGARDDDHDGMSNAAEYIAGTDYLDPTSYLKVDITGSGAAIQFNAVANRSYTVLYADGFPPTQWRKLADVQARGLTRPESVFDPGSRTNRYYRLVIPTQP